MEFYFGTVISTLLEVTFTYTFTSKCRKDNPVHASVANASRGQYKQGEGPNISKGFECDLSESFAAGINKGINLVSGL